MINSINSIFIFVSVNSKLHTTHTYTMQETYKVLIIGNGNSGKTSLIKRVRTNEIEVRNISTLGSRSSSY